MTDSPPQLIDVNLRIRHAPVAVLGPILIGFAGLVAIIAVMPSRDEVEFVRIILAQVLFLGVFILLTRRIIAARLRKRIEDILHLDNDAACERLLDEAYAVPSLASRETHATLLVRALVAAGRVNTTIRNCPPKYATPIEPITMPFEPLNLGEAATFFGELDDSMADQPDADLLEPEALEQLRTERTGKTQPRLKPRKGTGWALAGLLVLPTAAGAMFLFSRGDITWPGIFLALLVIFGLFSWGYISGLLQREQWFLVPGGLILREARLIRPEWKVHLFDRRRSVLIVRRIDHGRRIVFVADAETDKRVTVSPDESEFILRAWLSPIPPPSVDELSDLT